MSTWEWEKIKFTEPPSLVEFWDYHDEKPPMLPSSVLAEVTTNEALLLSETAHEARYQWRIGDWPRLPKELTAHLESGHGNAIASITKWDDDIRQAIYNNYTFLSQNFIPDCGLQWLWPNYLFGNGVLKRVMLAVPELGDCYTEREKAELSEFACDSGRLFFRMYVYMERCTTVVLS